MRKKRVRTAAQLANDQKLKEKAAVKRSNQAVAEPEDLVEDSLPEVIQLTPEEARELMLAQLEAKDAEEDAKAEADRLWREANPAAPQETGDVPNRAKLMVLDAYQVSQGWLQPRFATWDKQFNGDAWHVGIEGDDERYILLTVNKGDVQKQHLVEELGRVESDYGSALRRAQSHQMAMKRHYDIARGIRTTTEDRRDAEAREPQARAEEVLGNEQKARYEAFMEVADEMKGKIPELRNEIMRIGMDVQTWKFPLNLPALEIKF